MFVLFCACDVMNVLSVKKWKITKQFNTKKDNKYVVNETREHVDDISFRELFGRIRVVFFTK